MVESEMMAEEIREHHVSVNKGDILHLHGKSYRVLGSVALGMPIREVTFHLADIEKAPAAMTGA